MPLDPQAAAVLAKVPPLWRDVEAIRSLTAAAAREWMTETSDAVHEEAAVPAGVAVEAIELPGPDGPLRGRVYRPTASPPAGTALWIRGGGFVLGSLETERLAGLIVAASGCAIASIAYRLAPEHPFPGPLEDCYAAVRWVAEHARDIGGHAGPIAVGGESAGGNLAAAVALAARDRGGPEIALQVLLYPMIAREFDGGSRHDPEVGALACPEAIDWLWEQYLGDREGTDPLACPLRAESLAGLPPALVVTAEYDVLRDEGEAYAARLEREGVPVELRRYDGMHHGFSDSPEEIDAGAASIEQIGSALRRALSA